MPLKHRLRTTLSRLLWSPDYERLAAEEADGHEHSLSPVPHDDHRLYDSDSDIDYDADDATGVRKAGATRRVPLSGGGTPRRSAFDQDLSDHWKPVAGFEGAHRFDPKFRWSASEEKALVKRIDWRVCAWVCFMFFAMQLDRGNIGQALADNMLDDLGLDTNDFNTGTSIFFFCFLCAELPSQVIGKWLGPDRWIPIQMMTWSVLASMQAFLSGRKSFFLFRGLLGMMEGGFVPDIILYLSYWYTSKELPARLSFFWVSFQFTYIISAFLAFGILHMRGVWGFAGWQWLFGLEGVGTWLIGLVSFYYLPPSPTQTASAFRGEAGWFTEREEKILVNRVLRDDPSKGDMHNRQGLTLQMLWQGLMDYDLWPIYLLGLTWLVPQYPVGQYLTLHLRAEGFDPFTTNLLCIPAYVIFIGHLLLWTWVSEQVNERLLLSLVNIAWVLPLLIILEYLPATASTWTRWFLTIMVVGGPYVHAIIVAVTSRNSGSVRTRTVSSAIYNMCVQASSIFASQIYREDDKPMYRRGNKILIAICIYNACAFIAAKVYYVRANRARDAKWRRMSHREKERYIETTRDEGNKRLDFRFAH